MSDLPYLERVDGYRKEKETRLQQALPLRTPTTNRVQQPYTGMMGRPDNVEPELLPENDPNNPLKLQFDKYAEDPKFSQGFEQMVTALEAMRKDMAGMDLPEDVKRSRIQGLIGKFKNISMVDQASKLSGQQSPLDVPPMMGGGMNGY